MPTISVIVVDDSVTIRALLEALLHEDPKVKLVGVASNAEEARDLMRTKPHGVVILDLVMPGTSGFQLLEELSQRHHAPVIVVSSSTKPGTAAEREALSRGAFACFDKAAILSDAKGLLRLLHKAGAAGHPRLAA